MLLRKTFLNILKISRKAPRIPQRICYSLFSSSSNPDNGNQKKPEAVAAPTPEDLKNQAKKVLESSMKDEEQQFFMNDKVFTAKIGENTLTYALSDEIGGTSVGVGGFYVIMFTCEFCEAKSVKAFSKKSYKEGVVMIRCEGCDKIHLIADNLGWFEDKPVNVEELMARKNKKVIKINDNPVVSSILSRFMKKKTIIEPDEQTTQEVEQKKPEIEKK